jgi:dGTPase
MATPMSWTRLLSSRRADGEPGTGRPEQRSDFERDYHRILFSYPFRRLQGKTQVFPLPSNDHIHNRLTHSLEVASVGRSLGKAVGAAICQRHPELVAAGFHASDFGDIVSAASLAHDIGNPPFGHAGEDAIARWFRDRREDPLLAGLAPHERVDLEHFEGNAQGFRIIARLSMYAQAGGMRLTAATLGTFAKYPQSSRHQRCAPHVARKKFNYFHAEAAAFRGVAEACGLLPWDEPEAWCRHPLAYLVEAADDICYTVLDAEDGYLTERFSFSEICELLEPIARIPRADGGGSHDEHVNRLRAKAIGALIDQVVAAFLDHEPALLDGSLASDLLSGVPAAPQVEAIKAISVPRCYHDHEVIQILLVGYRVVADLLDIFMPVVLGSKGERYEHHIRTFLPEEVRQAETPYQRVLAVTDFISGMTDEYAITTYRRLTGIELPGSRVVAAKR